MAGLFYTDEVVRRIPPEEVAIMRNRLKSYDKREFFAKAVAEVCRHTRKRDQAEIFHKLARFEIHHIIPLELNGSNQHKNLALVEHTLHSQIHKKIQEERRLEMDEEAIIRIPRMKGIVWGL